jgi:hypothetical protein
MRSLMVVVVAVSAAAFAGKKTVVVGAGDCKDGVLLSAIKDFQDASRLQLKGDLLEPDAVLRAVRPQATRSLDDISRQVDTARSLLYGGQNDRGLELVQDALTELERVSPQARPWALTVNALVLQAQLLKNLERQKDAAEAFRRVLRLDAGFKLDPDNYPPSTLAALDAVRKELARAKKLTLQVVATPPGAQVVVDGRELGRAPLKVELVPGTYRVALLSQDAVSFPHRVNLQRAETLQIDMGFEGAVAQQAPLCVNAELDSAAISLASSVAGEQVVVLRNAALRGNPPYVTGTLYEVGRAERVRNAGVRPEQLRDLMLYLFTGKPELAASAPVEKAPGVVEKAPEPAAERPVSVTPPPPVAPTTVADDSTLPALKVRSAVGFTTLFGGAALLITGAVLYAAVGAPDRALLDQSRDASGRFGPMFDQAVLGRVDSNTVLSFALMGVGVGAALAGVLTFTLFPGSPTVVVVAPTPTGTGGAFSVSGSF